MSKPSGTTKEESKAKWASSSLKQAFGIRKARTRLNSGPSDGPTRTGAALGRVSAGEDFLRHVGALEITAENESS